MQKQVVLSKKTFHADFLKTMLKIQENNYCVFCIISVINYYSYGICPFSEYYQHDAFTNMNSR